MTSALAMFGNTSFFYVAFNSSNSTFPPTTSQICQQGSIPFARLRFDTLNDFCWHINSQWFEQVSSSESDTAMLLYLWMQNFNSTPIADEAFGAALFFASKAYLNQTVAGTWTTTARAIVSSPGLSTVKPHKTLASTIVISALLLLQLLGLAALAVYIYQVPMWTSGLDALAMAQFGASMKRSYVPPIRAVNERDAEKLQKVDGLVGVIFVESPTNGGEKGSSSVSRDNVAEVPPPLLPSKVSSSVSTAHQGTPVPSSRLALGAPGLISWRFPPSTSKKNKGRQKGGSRSCNGWLLVFARKRPTKEMAKVREEEDV